MKITVLVISSRESLATLTESIEACWAAGLRVPGVSQLRIDLLVNGNLQLAQRMAEWSQSAASATASLRCWAHPIADKSLAWNHYVHHLWDGGDLSYFVDGYVRPGSHSFAALAAALAHDPAVLAASAVPSVGHSAEQVGSMLLAGGGLHGSLHVLRGRVVSALREIGFRLPLGLYRSDSMIAAVLCFNLDPASNTWEPRRVVAVPAATWQYDAPSLRRFKDWVAFAKRRVRQAQGAIESCAFRQHFAVDRKPINTLPRLGSDLVRLWVGQHPWQALALFIRRPLSGLGLVRALEARDWTLAEQFPIRLTDLPVRTASTPGAGG